MNTWVHGLGSLSPLVGLTLALVVGIPAGIFAWRVLRDMQRGVERDEAALREAQRGRGTTDSDASHEPPAGA